MQPVLSITLTAHPKVVEILLRLDGSQPPFVVGLLDDALAQHPVRGLVDGVDFVHAHPEVLRLPQQFLGEAVAQVDPFESALI